MAFIDLYNAVQAQEGRISTNWVRERCIEFSPIKSIREIWSSVLDPAFLRGCYIQGPMGEPCEISADGCLIVLSRAMCKAKPDGDHWRRFVLTKELMHTFDEDHEKAHDGETLEGQIEGLADPSAPYSPQVHAEGKAIWRACMVLCQETRRQAFKAQLAQNEISFEVLAAALQMPVVNVRRILMHERYEEIIQHLK
jgi:hypothetical protein